MAKYEKKIEQTDTGMVIASVIDTEAKQRIGLAFFTWPPFMQKTRLKRAHKWADHWVKNCEAYCTK